MATRVDRGEVVRLVEHEAAQLVEVLSRHEYDEEHLEGASHISLKELTAGAVGVLDATRPVIVYCWDELCDMSPRAAAPLEHLGFDRVYGYVAGKVDWMAAGLPTVHRDPSERRAIDADEPRPPSCPPDTPLGELPAERPVVVDVDSVVIGSVDREPPGSSARPVGEVMHLGSTTVRAHEPLDPLLERMRARHVDHVLVTTPEGRLLGIVRAR